MSNTVTIKGRVSTTSLRRGDIVTVERTEQIDALIARGYATVVDDAPASLTGVVAPPEGGGEDDDADTAAPVPPAKSASKAEWVEFLAEQGIETGEDDTRDDLVDHWHLVDRG